MRCVRWHGLLLLLLALCTLPARAHVGSKDVFEEVNAGPYKLYVTIRPPTVIPGVATLEVRSSGAALESIDATPTPMVGAAADHPPTPDALARSKSDPNFYTGSLWLMTQGSWEVRLRVHGAAGEQTVGIPVSAAALSTLKMQRSVAIVLIVLGIFLIAGLAGIIGAAVRESRLAPAAKPAPAQRRRAMIATVVSVALIVFFLWKADQWWNVEAAVASMKIFRPLAMQPILHGNSLRLLVSEPDTDPRSLKDSRVQHRTNHDFIPDHGKMMHLYAIREPQMDVAYHLHPALHGSEFDLDLPQMPAGTYTLYGDVVHSNGFPETLVTKLEIPTSMTGAPLAADDALGTPAPLSAGMLGTRYRLPDGYTMVWDAPANLTASTAYALRFHLLDASGNEAHDMQPYLGMAGHAAFVKTDGSVFAHVHPEGSAAMASMMLANGQSNNSTTMADMPGMAMSPISSTVEFPYGFPSAGRYRIFVQMKHGDTVETAAFDAQVH